MKADKLFSTPQGFSLHLKALRAERKKGKRQAVMRSLTQLQRKVILAKTRGRCHVCGGKIRGERWSADHVFAHCQGGPHLVDNYLPAHDLCNNYRWFYGAEEFQWILKLGVWMRTRIEHQRPLAMSVIAQFIKYEKSRARRSMV
jgi:5-methylcytosine-specific restriction endonuclease McrA